MEMELDPTAGMTISMDAPRILRKDMTLLSELIAKYRGIKLTLMAGGSASDEVVKELSDLDITFMNARQSLQHVIDKISVPSPVPGVVGGHSTSDLKGDVAQLNAEIDDAGNVAHPGQDAHDAAEKARKKYRKP